MNWKHWAWVGLIVFGAVYLFKPGWLKRGAGRQGGTYGGPDGNAGMTRGARG